MSKRNIEGWGKVEYRVELPPLANPDAIIYVAADAWRTDEIGCLHFGIDDEIMMTFAPGTWARVTVMGNVDDGEDEE
jgi:hypothetical protein